MSEFDETVEPELTADERALLEDLPELTELGEARRKFLGQSAMYGLGAFAMNLLAQEQVFAEFGWPCATRIEFGTLDGILGCVAADVGVTLLPRAVVERAGLNGSIRAHALSSQKRVETL